MALEFLRRFPMRGRRILATGLLVILSLSFFIAHARAWHSTHRPVGLGDDKPFALKHPAMTLDLVTVTLFIIRRPPMVVSRSPVAWIVGIIGAYGLLAARPHYEPVGNLGNVLTVVQLAAATAASISLITLGRSFGIVAANRGVRTVGPYSVVRHPAYAAYILTVTAYVLENPSWRNAIVIVAVATALLFRIREEESCLGEDPSYAEYRTRVRYRLLPFVF